ncbi:MAG: tetratricopeptide repeat protein [Rhodospirillaceae bacterium]|nr:tetratricopeptide repeat protein [Rhodospirillaceae bacterium]
MAACTDLIASGAFAGPALADILLRRAAVVARTGSPLLAFDHPPEEDLAAAAEADPASAEVWRRLGLWELARNQGGPAAAHFSRALQIAPGDANLHGLRGRALLLAGEVDAAVEDLDMAVAGDPGNAAHLAQLGLARAASGDEAAALDAFAAALAVAERDPEVSALLGEAMFARGRYAEALAAYRDLLDDPDHAGPAHLGTALAACALGRVAAAGATIAQSLERRLFAAGDWRNMLLATGYLEGEVVTDPAAVAAVERTAEFDAALARWLTDRCPTPPKD